MKKLLVKIIKKIGEVLKYISKKRFINSRILLFVRVYFYLIKRYRKSMFLVNIAVIIGLVIWLDLSYERFKMLIIITST